MKLILGGDVNVLAYFLYVLYINFFRFFRYCRRRISLSWLLLWFLLLFVVVYWLIFWSGFNVWVVRFLIIFKSKDNILSLKGIFLKILEVFGDSFINLYLLSNFFIFII